MQQGWWAVSNPRVIILGAHEYMCFREGGRENENKRVQDICSYLVRVFTPLALHRIPQRCTRASSRSFVDVPGRTQSLKNVSLDAVSCHGNFGVCPSPVLYLVEVRQGTNKTGRRDAAHAESVSVRRATEAAGHLKLLFRMYTIITQCTLYSNNAHYIKSCTL